MKKYILVFIKASLKKLCCNSSTHNLQFRMANNLIPIAFCLFFSSCYSPRYVYSPSAHNVPLLTQKGESKLAINYSANIINKVRKENVATRQKAHGFDAQAAYAINTHWVLVCNLMKRRETNAGDFDAGNWDSVVINYKRQLTELGGGYNFYLNKNKSVLVQVLGGVGWGKSSFTDEGRSFNLPYHNNYHNMQITKYFLQPSISLRVKNFFSASLSSRQSFIYFKNIQTDYTINELQNYKLDSLSFSPRIFWEPSTVYTFGFKNAPWLKLEFQGGFAFLMSKRFVDARVFNFSAGINVDLPKLFIKPVIAKKK